MARNPKPTRRHRKKRLRERSYRPTVEEARARGDGLAADLATCVRLRDQALAEVERLRGQVNRVSVWMEEMATLAEDHTRWRELAAAVRSAVHAV